MEGILIEDDLVGAEGAESGGESEEEMGSEDRVSFESDEEGGEEEEGEGEEDSGEEVIREGRLGANVRGAQRGGSKLPAATVRELEVCDCFRA